MIRSILLSAAAAATFAASPAAAATVSAREPQSLVDALTAAGHSATLGTDDLGDPQIEFEMRGWKGVLLFYDCSAAHDRCGSVQFLSRFDAPDAGMSAADALAFVGDRRFVALSLDPSGDPTATWDVVLGDGISDKLFQTIAGSFAESLSVLGAQIFAK